MIQLINVQLVGVI